MLLYIYLGSTAFVWYTTIRHYQKMDKRLKKEGYTFNNDKPSFDILGGTIIAIALSVPVLNLFIPLMNIDKERSYDEYKNYLLDAGAIDEPLDEVENTIVQHIITLDNTLESEKTVDAIKKKDVISIDNSMLTERTNRYGHIYYSTALPDEIDDLSQSSHVYKKTLFKNRNK